MLTVIVAFVAGAILGWALMSSRIARMMAERDVARAHAAHVEQWSMQEISLRADRVVSKYWMQLNARG